MRRIGIVIAVAVCSVLILSSLRIVSDDEVALVGVGEKARELDPGANFLRPFARIRRYKLRQKHVFAGDGALTIRLRAGQSALLDCEVELAISRDRVRDLDRDYGGAVFEKLIRPLLVRELSAAFAGGFDLRGAFLENAATEIATVVSEKTRSLGIVVAAVHLENPRRSERLSHDLEKNDGVKVFILGLDGYDWLVMDKVAKSHDLANIKRVRTEGTWGNLRSIEPLVSPLIWTTMVTGVTPDIHGVTDFLVRDDQTGEDVPITSSTRRVPALWNITSLFDLKCGFIGWFASFPAEETVGFIVSDRFAYHMFDPRARTGQEDSARRGITYPADLHDEIKPLNVGPDEVRDDLSTYIHGPIGDLRDEYSPNDPDSNLRLIIAAYRTYENVMKRLYPDYGPDLFGIYFEFTDSVCHLFMKYMRPPMAGLTAEEEQRYGDAIAATYMEADRIIGDVIGMLDESTVLMIVSDHGFKSGDMRPLSDSRVGFGQAVEWHRINGSIAFYGDIVKRGHQLLDASVLDVAPTVLYLLGLPVDRKMTGKALVDAFEDSWVERHSITYTTKYDSLLGGGEYIGPLAGADKTLKAKLVSLGYVAGGGQSLVNLANYYHKNGKFAEALEVWKQIAEHDPDDIGARVGMSNAYFELGKIDLAVRGLKGVLERDPRNLKALHSISNVYLLSGDPEEALRYADTALAVDRTDGKSHFAKGLPLQHMGRYEEAAHEYREAIRLAPDLPEAYANLAEIYVHSGRGTQALDLAQRGVELASGRSDMRYVLALALNASGRKHEALREFISVVNMDSTFVPAYIGASGILLSEGRTDSVVAICAKALAIPSEYGVYLHDIKGSAHAMRGELEKAEHDFRSALAIDGAHIHARVNLAKVLMQRGDRREAVEELEAVLSVAPDNAEARKLLATLKQ